MKNAIWLLVCFAFAKAYTVQAQVFIDKVNAPLNPVGPYAHELAAINVNGSVYAVEYARYERDGKLKYAASSYSLQEAIKNKWAYTEMKNGLITVEKPSFSENPTYFEYNANKCLIREKNQFWTYTYTYDSKKRLIEKKSIRLDGTKPNEASSYSYNQIGDVLHIVTTIKDSKERNSILKQQFKNGLEISRQWNDEKLITRSYIFDSKGNWIEEETINPGHASEPRTRELVYYNDIDAIIRNKKLDWEKYPAVKGADIFFPFVKTSNQYMTKHMNPGRAIGNGALYYLDLGSRYYYNDGAFASYSDKGTKGMAVEVSAGSESLFQYKDNLVLLVDGNKTPKNLKHINFGDDYYLSDTINAIHYLVKNYKNSSNTFTPAKKYEGEIAFYGKNSAKSTVVIIKNGKILDYSKIGAFQYTQNDEPVVIYDGKPILVLKGYHNLPDDQLHTASPYKNEALKKASAQADKGREQFKDNLPLYVKPITNEEFLFIQNQKIITSATLLDTDVTKEDLFIFYDKHFYVVYNYKTAPLEQPVLAQKIGTSVDFIAHYKDGLTAYYYYYEGKILYPDKDYISKTIATDKRLVYLPKLGKSVIVDNKISKEIKYKTFTPVGKNDYLKITDTGSIVPYTNGNYIPNTDYKFYVDKAGNAHIYVHDKPAFYLSNYDKLPRPSIQTLEKHTGQTYVEDGTTNNSTTTSNASLSQNAQRLISAQKDTDAKSKTKTILKEMDDALIAKGMAATLRVDMFASLFKEVYPVDKEAAYQIALHMPRSIDVGAFLALLTAEQKAFVKTRSRQTISSYKGATSN